MGHIYRATVIGVVFLEIDVDQLRVSWREYDWRNLSVLTLCLISILFVVFKKCSLNTQMMHFISKKSVAHFTYSVVKGFLTLDDKIRFTK